MRITTEDLCKKIFTHLFDTVISKYNLDSQEQLINDHKEVLIRFVCSGVKFGFQNPNLLSTGQNILMRSIFRVVFAMGSAAEIVGGKQGHDLNIDSVVEEAIQKIRKKQAALKLTFDRQKDEKETLEKSKQEKEIFDRIYASYSIRESREHRHYLRPEREDRREALRAVIKEYVWAIDGPGLFAYVDTIGQGCEEWYRTVYNATTKREKERVEAAVPAAAAAAAQAAAAVVQVAAPAVAAQAVAAQVIAPAAEATGAQPAILYAARDAAQARIRHLQAPGGALLSATNSSVKP